MKQEKILITEKAKSTTNYFFIKPFGIVSTYLSFVDTWKVVNKVCKDIDEVKDVFLMQSLSENSKFGFISYSKWDSKESFNASVQNNTALKYHNEINGNGTKSAAANLYKLVSKNIINNNGKSESVFQVNVFEVDSSDDYVTDFWNNKCSKRGEDVQSLILYKSIYKNSKYRYIGLVFYNNVKDNIRNSVLLESQNGFKVFTSFFKIIKKF